MSIAILHLHNLHRDHSRNLLNMAKDPRSKFLHLHIKRTLLFDICTFSVIEFFRNKQFWVKNMKKVTIQDIADALGVSRNTVSKAINNADGLADATREKILQKAVEMGYKQFSYVSAFAAVSAAAPGEASPAGRQTARPKGRSQRR